jgi:hypothetical protein
MGRRGLISIPLTMLLGIVLVVSLSISRIRSQLAAPTRATIGIAMASVMLSFLMMITRRKAIPQVIGFLSMENGLFFAATSATYGSRWWSTGHRARHPGGDADPRRVLFPDPRAV